VRFCYDLRSNRRCERSCKKISSLRRVLDDDYGTTVSRQRIKPFLHDQLVLEFKLIFKFRGSSTVELPVELSFISSYIQTTYGKDRFSFFLACSGIVEAPYRFFSFEPLLAFSRPSFAPLDSLLRLAASTNPS